MYTPHWIQSVYVSFLTHCRVPLTPSLCGTGFDRDVSPIRVLMSALLLLIERSSFLGTGANILRNLRNPIDNSEDTQMEKSDAEGKSSFGRNEVEQNYYFIQKEPPNIVYSVLKTKSRHSFKRRDSLRSWPRKIESIHSNYCTTFVQTLCILHICIMTRPI